MIILKRDLPERNIPAFIESIEPIKTIGKIAAKPLIVSIAKDIHNRLILDIRIWKSETMPTRTGLCIGRSAAGLLKECIDEYLIRISENAKARNPDRIFENVGYNPFADPDE